MLESALLNDLSQLVSNEDVFEFLTTVRSVAEKYYGLRVSTFGIQNLSFTSTVRMSGGNHDGRGT